MKEFLSSNAIKYAYIDISSGMLGLKKFLKLRDRRPEFTEIKNAGRIGIPCIEIEDKLFFSEEELDIDWIKD